MVIPLIRGFQHILRNLKTETDIGDIFKNTLMDVARRRLDILEKNKIVAKATRLQLFYFIFIIATQSTI